MSGYYPFMLCTNIPRTNEELVHIIKTNYKIKKKVTVVGSAWSAWEKRERMSYPVYTHEINKYHGNHEWDAGTLSPDVLNYLLKKVKH